MIYLNLSMFLINNNYSLEIINPPYIRYIIIIYDYETIYYISIIKKWRFLFMKKNKLILIKLVIFVKLLLLFVLCSNSEAIDFKRSDIRSCVGNNIITFGNYTLKRYNTPDKYYKNLDYYSFLAYMSYKSIKLKNTPAYKITHSKLSYTDDNGYRRYRNNITQFSINNEDDYIVAMGNYYKTKGSAGDRFLIITDKSMYTVIVGDEKNDSHTDKLHMVEMRKNNRGNLLEFIVDMKRLEKNVKLMGTVTASKNEIINGRITHIYKIIE